MNYFSQNVEKVTRRQPLDIRLLAADIAVSFLIKAAPQMRDHLPEPFDIADHWGNMSGLFGYVAAITVGRFVVDRAQEKGKDISVGKVRTAMGAGALAIGAVANGISETKFGISLAPYLLNNTPDPLDFAYGVAVSVAVGAALPRVDIKKDEPTFVGDPAPVSNTI